METKGRFQIRNDQGSEKFVTFKFLFSEDKDPNRVRGTIPITNSTSVGTVGPDMSPFAFLGVIGNLDASVSPTITVLLEENPKRGIGTRREGRGGGCRRLKRRRDQG